MLLGFQTCVISTAYLVAHNCLKWGDGNVRHVSLRRRVFIFQKKKKNHSTANGNVNLPALFLKINKYKEFLM